jgi:hypothetical protein
MSRAGSLSFRVFATVTSIGILIVFFYYFSFLNKLVHLPYVFSPTEGLNLWAVLGNLQAKFNPAFFGKLPSFNDFKESLFYTGFLVSLTKIFSSNSKGPMLMILELGRFSSVIGLVLSGLFFWLLLQREKINSFIALSSVLLLLAVPTSQSLAFQARPELLAFCFGLIGLYLFYSAPPNASFAQSFLSALCLVAAYALTQQMAFLSFGLVCLLSLVLTKNGQQFKKFAFSFIALLALSGVLSVTLLGIRPLGWWSPQIWFANFDFLFFWPIFIGLICLLFAGKLYINLKHPAYKLLIVSLLINFWSMGLAVDRSGGWLISALAFCWILGVAFNASLNKASAGCVYSYLSILVLLIAVLVPLFEPLPLRIISENTNLVKQTATFVNEESTTGSKSNLLLSQDLGLALKLHKKIVLSDPNLLVSSSVAQNKLATMITDQNFSEIILGQVSTNIWPKSIVNSIKRYYSPTRKLFVLGGEGLLYEPKDLLDGSSNTSPNRSISQMNQSSENIYATFHKN